MKRLIVIRHSECKGDLTPEGRQVFEKLIEKLRPEWEGASMSIMSAPSDRTQESSKMIAAKTGAPISVVNDLDGEGFKSPSKEQWENILDQLKAQTADVVFAVMHREETEIMSHKVSEMLFTIEERKDMKSEFYKLNHNDSYVLDFEKKKVQTVWIPVQRQ
jgi:broad specificity phosphatase PhoE